MLAFDSLLVLVICLNAIQWEEWKTQVCVKQNPDGCEFQGCVFGTTTVEWRNVDSVHFREDNLGKEGTIVGSRTGKYLVVTRYDAAAAACYPSAARDDGTTSLVVKRQRDRLSSESQRAKPRVALVKHVSSILGHAASAIGDDLTSALVYHEEIYCPQRNYEHMLLEDGRLWVSRVRIFTGICLPYDQHVCRLKLRTPWQRIAPGTYSLSLWDRSNSADKIAIVMRIATETAEM